MERGPPDDTDHYLGGLDMPNWLLAVLVASWPISIGLLTWIVVRAP